MPGGIVGWKSADSSGSGKRNNNNKKCSRHFFKPFNLEYK